MLFSYSFEGSLLKVVGVGLAAAVLLYLLFSSKSSSSGHYYGIMLDAGCVTVGRV